MKNRPLLLAALAAGLLVPAIDAPPAHAEDIAQAIGQINAKFSEAVARRDAKALAQLYAEDAVLLPAGQPILVGRESIEKWAEGAIRSWNRLDISSEHSRAEGRMAWDAGTWRGNMNGPDGQPMEAGGSYLAVLAQEGSVWRVRADTWNVRPPETPAPAVGSSSPPAAGK